MLIAKRALSHVSKLDGSLGTRIHEPIAAGRVKLGSCDDLGELFHIRRFNIDNVETLVLNVEVPEVDSKIVGADKGLTIAVDGYAVDVVGVGIRIGFAGYGCDDSIVMGQAW